MGDEKEGRINPAFIDDGLTRTTTTTVVTPIKIYPPRIQKHVEPSKLPVHYTTPAATTGDPEVTSERASRRGIIKNLAMISLGFLLNFTAFSALSNIQSSLNSVNGLGTVALSAIYAALILSCMFVPPTLIKRLGTKWTMVVSMLVYSAYIAANFYATWWTLIPGAILVGLGAAPLWGAKCTYLTEIGHQYADLVGETAEVVVVRFFGVFFMVFQTAQVWGNLISSLVLAPPSTDTSESNLNNATLAPPQPPIHLGICGANYCNEDWTILGGDITNLTDGNFTAPVSGRPPMEQVYMLCGIYLACSVLGVVVMSVGVSPLTRTKTTNQKLAGWRLLVATFRHMKNYKQLLLIPLTIFSGVEQSFFSGDFTKAFVNCSLGIHNVGYVMICYGVVDALCSFAFGPLVKIVGRAPLYVFGAAVNVSLVVTMFYWMPNPDTPIVFYVISGLWGMADAIWQTQINAFYGLLFSDNTEAAFANYRLWESVGFIIGYIWNTYLCMTTKLWIVLIVLGLGMVGYFLVELMLKREKSTTSSKL